MKSVFITGTDTDAGKTITAAGIYINMIKQKIKTEIQKWVSTGDKDYKAQDLKFIYNCLINKDNIFDIDDNVICKINEDNNPYSFKFPASPHLSAELENQIIDINKIIKAYNILMKRNDCVIIEGAGGLMVPLNQQNLIIDLIKKLNIPVILVSKNVLGSINHTLLSIKIMKNYGLNILGIIYNNYFNTDKIIQKDNIKIISKFSNIETLGVINDINDYQKLYSSFKSITDKIINRLEL